MVTRQHPHQARFWLGKVVWINEIFAKIATPTVSLLI